MKNEKDLISVIVPIYNVELYIAKCIDSIVAQSYTNLEIILVNDGSLDNSGKICNDYAIKDLRIKVLHKKNGGLSDARNAGIDICRGDFIAFVDGDDLLHPDFVLNLFNHSREADIVFCGFHYFTDQQSLKDKLNIPSHIRTYQDFDKLALLNQMLTFKYPLSVIAWNKLYKRYIWDSLRFPKNMIHEDEYIAHHVIYACSTKIRYIDTELYLYRQRAQSITSDGKSAKAINDKLVAYENRKKFFSEIGLDYASNTISRLILEKLASRDVKSDNLVWKALSWKDIFCTANLSLRYRVILSIKKIHLPTYNMMVRLKSVFI